MRAAAQPGTRRAGAAYCAFVTARLCSQAAKALLFASLFLIGAGETNVGVLSGIVIAMLVGAILLGVPAGALVDRISPGPGLALGALLRAAAIASTFAAIERPELVPLVAFGYSAASQVYSSAELAMVRQVDHTRHCRGHASLLAVQYVGQGAALLAIGPAAFWLGGVGALLLAAVSLYVPVLGAALLLARATRERSPARRAPERRVDLASGLRFLIAEPRAGYAFGVLAFADLVTSVMLVVLPFYVRDEINAGGPGTVALMAAVGLGVVGGLAIGARIVALPHATGVMRGTLVATSLAALALAGNALPSFAGLALALLCFAVLGAAFSMAPIAARSVFSGTAAVGAQARVFATQASFTDLVVIGPLLLALGSADLLGARVTLLLVATAGALLLPALEGWLTRRSRPRVPAVAVGASAPS